MQYQLINKDKYFYRKESTGSGILCIKEYGYQVFLNKTGCIILELLEKNTDTADVLNELSNLFPVVNKLTLKKDLIDLIDLFKLYTLIKCDDEVNENENGFFFAGDTDYCELTKFITRNLKSNIYNFSQAKSDKYYDSVSLRYRTFHSQEYYLIKRIKGKINAALSLLPPNGVSNVVTISGLYAKKELSENDIKSLMEQSFECIDLKIPNQINKFRINILGNVNSKDNSILISLLENIGFHKECVLLREMNNQDITMYSKDNIK